MLIFITGMEIEKQLLIACIHQERKAQFALYKKCYGVLMSVCMRYKKNREDAAELVNQGFLKILHNIEKYNQTAPFEAWIRKIMVNTVIDEFRRDKKDIDSLEYSDFQNNHYYNQHKEENLADLHFNAEELEEMLHELPPVSKHVFNLFAIEGFGHKEIGEMLHISEGTSKWHVNFARTKLKELILLRKKKEQEILKAANG